MISKRALAMASLCLALPGAGCAGLFPSPVTPDTGTPAAGPRRDFLAIAEVRWVQGGEVLVTLSREGVIRARGAVVGTLRADGTFTTRDGKRTLVMDPDGTAHVAPGIDVVIGVDGTEVSRVHGQPDTTVTLDQVKQPRDGRPALTVEGMPPGAERTAMWILMIPDLLLMAASAGDG